MLDPTDPLVYDILFPGSVTGSAEVDCPHCSELLSVPVNDACGEETYSCSECGGGFVVDWLEEMVRAI
jgi:hypothetical protein